MSVAKKKITVLVSGSGTNLQRIIDCVQSGEIRNTEISTVIADRECLALERAAKHGIKNVRLQRGPDFSSQLNKVIPADTELIVLAGFLSILDKHFCENFSGKIINIHPALLPKFGGKGMWGKHVHTAVLSAGEKESGASVHYVTAGIDEGGVILQQSFPVSEKETPDTLAEKVHAIEHEILPQAIDQLLNKSDRIAFITDLHLLEKNVSKKGVDAVANWKTVLQDVKARGISRIILGGDLGEKEALKIIFDDIKDFDFQVILGNHDKISDFKTFFPKTVGKQELYYSAQISGTDCIFLDTSSYKLSKEQSNYLKNWLESAENPVVLIHHPVLDDGSWMDREHPLKNKTQVEEILRQSGKNVTLISGHYHHFYEVTSDKIRQVISPAVSYQILNSKSYQADTKSFGYLILGFSEQEVSIEAVNFSV